MRINILLIIIFFSCKQENDISINYINNDKDILLLPSYNMKDSVDIYIPYTYEIKNFSNYDLRLTDIDYKPFNKFLDTDYLVEENNNIKRSFSDEYENINKEITKSFTIYFKKRSPKKEVNPKYWNLFKTGSGRKLYFNTNFNRISSTEHYYQILKQKIIQDSLALTFYHKNDYMIIKVCKLGENKFKTITTDDILENQDRIYESIFKP